MMLDTFNTLLSERDEDEISDYIKSYPEVLDIVDKNGVSIFTTLSYHNLPVSFETAVEYKSDFSFHESIIANKIELMKFLLDNDPLLLDQYSGDGFSPVSLAAFFNREVICAFLVEKGANVNLSAKNPSKVAALHAAVAKQNLSLCALLIENGADVNQVQTSGVTALHAAAHKGNLDLMKLLLKNGAYIDLKMENGDTVFSILEKDGHKEVLSSIKNIIGE